MRRRWCSCLRLTSSRSSATPSMLRAQQARRDGATRRGPTRSPWRAGKEWSTKDSVVLSKNADDITGIGTNIKYGKYFLSGKLSKSNMLTLLYHGEHDRVHARGVILLHLNVTMTEMDGHWIECGY